MRHEGGAHGKAILLGEHSVVEGHHALVVSLPAGMSAVDGGPADVLRVSVEPWGLAAAADAGGSLPDRALAALAGELARRGLEPEDVRRNVLVRARIPPGAGLGSSAALAVSVSRLLCAGAGRRELLEADSLDALAASSEQVFHGRASGIDALAVIREGVGVFSRSRGFRRVNPGASLSLVIADSGSRPPTAVMVEKVADRCSNDACARATLRRLGELAELGTRALVEGETASLGGAMNEAQGHLAELGISTSEVDALVRAAREAGALGAKLTGAGGGGCVIALCDDHDAGAVLASLSERSSWVKCFRVPAGGADDE